MAASNQATEAVKKAIAGEVEDEDFSESQELETEDFEDVQKTALFS